MRVGWYVHHQGAGHRVRQQAVAQELEDVTALSSLPRPPDAVGGWLTLPGDEDPRPRAASAGGTLHWAPLDHDGLRERMAAIADWVRRHRPDVFVVDVSVEVSLLARLLGVPVVQVAQRGRRHDAPHALAYAQSAAVVVPWTPATHLAGDGPPEERLRFVGAISRLDATAPGPPREPGSVLLLLGAGGHGIDAGAVRAAAAATPGRTWHVAGPLRVDGPGVVDHGPQADVPALLRRCGVVVGSAGANVVAEVAAARRPYVCLPQPRPFQEQERQGDALARLGVAEVLGRWPTPDRWPAILAAAQMRDPSGWAELHDGRGAQRMAAVVAEVAAGGPAPVTAAVAA